MASAATVATLAAQLAGTLFKVCHDVKRAEKKAQELANNLLALVLET